MPSSGGVPFLQQEKGIAKHKETESRDVKSFIPVFRYNDYRRISETKKTKNS